MSETSEQRFVKSRDRLALALQNLEEIVTNKIHETALNARMLEVAGNDDDALRSRLLEQLAIVQNLSEELNKIQKINSEISKENDFLKDKNRFFADKAFKFKTDGSSLIQAVEEDLTRIKEIIKNQ